MQKFGGGKELTKQPADEIAIKCHVSLDHTAKVRSEVAGIFEKNALSIPSPPVGSKVEIVRKVKLVATRKEIFKAELENVMSEICNIEDNVEPEKPVKIDLQVDLYQMEEP